MKNTHQHRSRLFYALVAILSCAAVVTSPTYEAAQAHTIDVPVFDYPVNGQTLDYEGAYLLRVLPVQNVTAYLWGFFQNSVLIWENQRDEGHLNGNDYAIYPCSLAHSHFAPGAVEVWVRAQIGNTWSDPAIITIQLKESSAATVTPCPSTPTPTLTPSRTATPPEIAALHRVPVVQIDYYPPDPNNAAYLDPTETGWHDGDYKTIESWRQATQEMVVAGIQSINSATRYHGYRDATAPLSLEYYVLNRFERLQAMPRGHDLGNGHRPNYNQILTEIDICNFVDQQNVKEVWIYGYHSTTIVPDESKMSSKYGDVSNALPKDEEIEAQFRLPRCDHSYVMYNFTYQPCGRFCFGNTVHNRMHQIENVVFYAENKGYPPNNDNIIGSQFWDDFAVYGNRSALAGYRASCGNTHSPPNVSADQGYVYDALSTVESNCESWNPNDNLTVYQPLNCTRWGCTDVGFYTWFMQSLPGYNNGIAYNGCAMRNWWELMYDFNKFIDDGRSLYACGATATPSPTINPNLSERVYVPVTMR